MAIGNGKKKAQEIAGSENAIDAVEFLKAVSLGENPEVKDTVVVIGKGFAAVDAARSAVRLGAKQVTLVCPVRYGKSSYEAENLALMEKEGIALIDAAAVKAINADFVTIERSGAVLTLAAKQVILGLNLSF